MIPTNIGWTKDGRNPMGRGVAWQAARTYTDLPLWYGALCAQHKAALPVCSHNPYKLILFPTKPLNPRNPAMSWQGPATLDLVRKSRVELVQLLPNLIKGGRVLIPAVGCGEGDLDPKVVVPELLELMEYHPEIQVVLDAETAMAAGLATVTPLDQACGS